MTSYFNISEAEISSNKSFRPKPDGKSDPVGEIGWFLQREREKSGKSLADIAAQTHINVKYLHAIEVGALSNLPGRAYIIGYVRAYARSLGLEVAPLVAHYNSILPDDKPDEANKMTNATTIKNNSSQSLVFGFKGEKVIIAVTAFSLCAFFISGFLYYSTREKEVAVDDRLLNDRRIIETKGAVVKITQNKLIDVINKNNTPSSGKDNSTSDVKEIADPYVVGDFPNSDVVTDFITRKINEDMQNSKVYGSNSKEVRMVLRAVAPVWLMIENKDGGLVLNKTLNVGDSFRVPNDKELKLTTRNGGALSYTIDGVEKGLLGTRGEVIKDKSLNIAGRTQQ